jgi:acyl-coenzyme A thioesterase PaaI-like protein
MRAIMDKSTAVTELTDMRARCHPDCYACRPESEGGLGLRFAADGAGRVVAEFACAARYQGYPGRLHGGVVATMLDAGMTQWLFAEGLAGVTGRMELRYRHPVLIERPATVRAWCTREHRPLYVMHAEVEQNGRVCALAEAKFQIGSVMEGD